MTKELVESEDRTRLLREQPEGPKHAKRRGFDTDELMSEFQAMSRQPFVEILSELIAGIPTPENIRAFSSDHPDRWVNAIKGMANLAGYHDKLDISGSIALDVNKLGDAQLMERLEDLGKKIDSMGIRGGIVTDAEFEEVDKKKDAPEGTP